MKRLKLKAKAKNGSTKETQKTLSIHERILNDPSCINDINKLIKEYVEYLQNNDYKKINFSFKNLELIFKKYLDKKQSFDVNQELLNFLINKVDLLLNLLIEAIDLDEEDCTSEILSNISSLFSFKEEVDSLKNYMVNIIYKLFLTEKLLDNNIIESINSNIVNSFFVETFFNTLYERINEYSLIHKNSFYNIYNFLILIDNNILVKNVNINININPITQNIITHLINNNYFPQELLQNFLLNFNKKFLDKIENPLIFSDYFINIYEKSKTNLDMKILSLSGLFVLITKFHLDYQLYYQKLYETLSITYDKSNQLLSVFDSKYAKRFIKILELSLTSSTVPIILVMSFVKKLARISMTSEIKNIVIILCLIFNIMKTHPKSLRLLSAKLKEGKYKHIETKDNELDEELLLHESDTENNTDVITLSKYDQFKNEEIDPYKTNANRTGLWELYALKNHYCSKIRKLVKKFEKNFSKGANFNIETFSKVKESDFMYIFNEKTNFLLNHKLVENEDQITRIYDFIKNITNIN